MIDRSKRLEIEENDPRNVRASGRMRPATLEERTCIALESIADSLAKIAEEISKPKPD